MSSYLAALRHFSSFVTLIKLTLWISVHTSGEKSWHFSPNNRQKRHSVGLSGSKIHRSTSLDLPISVPDCLSTSWRTYSITQNPPPVLHKITRPYPAHHIHHHDPVHLFHCCVVQYQQNVNEGWQTPHNADRCCPVSHCIVPSVHERRRSGLHIACCILYRILSGHHYEFSHKLYLLGDWRKE